ncbi:hypothetical protein [Umezawaea sp.]|uniref:hypothetical protein n=1 Tax=Umezawaea sp. TaxID=1955258 RepID=UPI002ED280F7
MEPTRVLFEIGLLGPSRVGKTSLVSSLFRDGQRLLKTSGVTIRANDRATEVKMRQQARALDSLVQSRRFTPGALAANHTTVSFELLLDPGSAEDTAEETGIALRLLDFPGGWLDPANRSTAHEQAWSEVEGFIVRSSVLVVPVDATVLMEAVTAPQRGAVPLVLDTYDVGQVARRWARSRAERPDSPALVLFVPVKCESYFADNGGRHDRADELFDRFRSVYGDVLDAIAGEAEHTEMLYVPVDTLGCVERMSGRWVPDEDTHLRFEGRFLVRSRPVLSIHGVEDVLIALCKTLLAARKTAEEQHVLATAEDAHAARGLAERDRGLVGNFFRLVDELATDAYGQDRVLDFVDRRTSVLRGLGLRRFGEYTSEVRAADRLDGAHQRALERLRLLDAVVDDFSGRSYSSRVRSPLAARAH